MKMMKVTRIKRALLLFSILFLTSCAARQAFKAGLEAEKMKDWDKAIFQYTVALKNDPINVEYRVRLDTACRMSSRSHLNNAELLFKEGKAIEAFQEYKLAIDVDPQNKNASFLYQEARNKYRNTLEKERLEKRKTAAERSSQGVPKLQLKSDARLTLDFQNKRVRDIYTAMGKLAGLNIFFEESLKNNLASFTVKDVSFLEALETFAMANRHFFKIINDTSIFVIPDNAQLRKDYETVAMRVFFLENLQAKLARDYIRTIVGITRFIHSDELNAVIIRGTPGQIAATEKLVEILDRPRGEVILDVEVLEVSRTNLNNVGFLLGDYATTQSTQRILTTSATDTSTTAAATAASTLAANNLSFLELSHLGSQNLFLTIPSFTMNFLRQDSDTRLIAKPQIKILDREKAQLHVGESVPVRSTTYNVASTTAVTPIDNYQYRDIGIKLEFEPTINNNNEMTLKLSVEISTKLAENSAGMPTFGQKKITSAISLRDGETNMLAGLIKEENKGTLTGIEGLSRIPLLGRLFSNDDVEVTKLDTIITITGYIIRSPEISEADLRAVTIGTESNIGISLSDMLNNKPKGGESILVDNKKIEELMQDEKPSAAPATVIPPQTGVPAGQIQEQRKETPPEEQPENYKTAAPPVIENEQVTLEPPPESLPADLTEVTIQPSTVTTTTGQAFSVQVVIDNGKDVGHAPFYLIFDPNYLEVLDVSQGGYLAQDGRQVSFLHSENNATGEIRVGLSRLGATEGVNGSGVLAVFTFKAKERGKSYLTFTNCSVKNPRAENLPVEFLPAEVNVE